MTRFALLLLGLALAGATGCAQCDTCDDFPAPCTGPNCGPNGYATNGFVPPTQDGLPAGAERAMPSTDPGAPDEAIPPAGTSPSMPSPTMPPTVSPSSPPSPNQP